MRKKEDNTSNATSSILIGVISVIALLFITKFSIPLAIIGIVFAILSKSKNRKIIGITLNTLVILISIFLLTTNQEFNLLDKYEIQGTWNCKAYNGITESANYVASMNLKSKNNFSWYKYNDYINNRINGTFAYTKLIENNNKNNYSITLNGKNHYINGQSQNDNYIARYKLEIKNNHAIMINLDNDNMYSCYKEKKSGK